MIRDQDIVAQHLDEGIKKDRGTRRRIVSGCSILVRYIARNMIRGTRNKKELYLSQRTQSTQRYFTFPMNSGTAEFMGSSMSDCVDLSHNQTGKKKTSLRPLWARVTHKRYGRETKGL